MASIKIDGVGLNMEVVSKMTSTQFLNDPGIKSLFPAKTKSQLMDVYRIINPKPIEVKLTTIEEQ